MFIKVCQSQGQVEKAPTFHSYLSELNVRQREVHPSVE